jgi:hypothetical protein
MAAPAPLANIVVPAMPPQTAIMFGFPAPGTAIPNPTMADYINAEDLLKHSNSLPAADQAAIKQFCGDVMLAVHPNLQAMVAATLAPLADQVAAIGAQLTAMAAQQAAIGAQLTAMTAQLTAMAAQLTAMADQVAAMPDMILARQCANEMRRAHVNIGVHNDLMKLPCEKIHVGLAPDIEPPSGLSAGDGHNMPLFTHTISLSVCLSVCVYLSVCLYPLCPARYFLLPSLCPPTPTPDPPRCWGERP